MHHYFADRRSSLICNLQSTVLNDHRRRVWGGGGGFGARAPPAILHRGLSPCGRFAALIAVNVVICFFGMKN
jgi:hypothetical protein